MKLSSKCRIISYLLNIGIYFMIITIYAEIFPNYLNIIPHIVNNTNNKDNFFIHFIIGYINFLIIFSIPIIFVWLINFIFVLFAKKTFTSIFVIWLFKNLIMSEQIKLESKNNNRKMINNNLLTDNEISDDTEVTYMDKFNYDMMKQGNILSFMVLSILHLIFLLPFIGWIIGIMYFVWTIILTKKIPFIKRWFKMFVRAKQ